MLTRQTGKRASHERQIEMKRCRIYHVYSIIQFNALTLTNFKIVDDIQYYSPYKDKKSQKVVVNIKMSSVFYGSTLC